MNDALNADIFSRYPILSSRLRNVSKELENKTLRGSCSLPISNHEITNKIIPYFKNYGHGQRIIFINNKEENLLDGILINSVPFGNEGEFVVQHIKSYFVKESGIYTILRDEGYLGNITYQHVKEIVEYHIDMLDDIYFDLITIKNFYKQRKLCVGDIENYATSKTLDYLANVYSTFNFFGERLHLLNYLILNCYVFGIDLTVSFTLIDIDYKTYKETESSIIETNDTLYDALVEKINSME